MSGTDQCALCLSCGAPFLPAKGGVSLYGRRGNLSILYIDDKCRTNRVMLETYDKPCFANVREEAHMIHGSHHEAALEYMCKRHKTDAGAGDPVANTPIPVQDGPFAYYKSASKAESPFVAAWDQPPAQDRVDLTPLWEHLVGTAPESVPRDRRGVVQTDLGLTYPMCQSCNALMTQLSYMRYIVGFASTADKNTYGSVIRDSSQVIRAYSANKGNGARKLSDAYGKWRVPAASMGRVVMLPSRATADDPEAPHIAYYLHLCQPFQAVPGTDPFDSLPWLQNSNSVESARTAFFQQAWVLLVIACVATQIEQGKLYGSHKLTHGMHQHYGVLDVYVSYFIWNLCRYDYAPQLAVTGMDFLQWHQKYFWFAAELPGLGARDYACVGLACYNNVKVPSRDLLSHVCGRLMDLYCGALRPLVQFVTNTFPLPPHTPAVSFAKRYFIPLVALQTLRRACHGGVREDNFESGLETVGMRAMLARVMRLCHPELLPMLKSFRRSWLQLETDRVRSKTPGLTMYSAGIVVRLCELLSPPVELPKDKEVLSAVLRGRRCSPWTSVLALREMGAFTSG